MKRHQYTHTLKQNRRKSAYQALRAAFFQLKPSAILNINQKVVLCHSSALPHRFKKAELSTTGRCTGRTN